MPILLFFSEKKDANAVVRWVRCNDCRGKKFNQMRKFFLKVANSCKILQEMSTILQEWSAFVQESEWFCTVLKDPLRK